MRGVIIFPALLVVAFAGSAAAGTFGGKDVAVKAAFEAKLVAVCQHPTMVLTTAARTACASGNFPRLAAAAKAFINSGTGAEFNTLMRQLPPYEVPAAVVGLPAPAPAIGTVTATATATPIRSAR